MAIPAVTDRPGMGKNAGAEVDSLITPAPEAATRVMATPAAGLAAAAMLFTALVVGTRLQTTASAPPYQPRMPGWAELEPRLL
jgi:hypothetical protein